MDSSRLERSAKRHSGEFPDEVLVEAISQQRTGALSETLHRSAMRCRISSVHRRLCQVTVVVLLIIYLCGPAFERVDHWDHFPQSRNDIVLNLVAFAVSLGAVAALSHLLRGLIGRPRNESALAPAPLLEEFSLSACSRPFLGLSPPTLRI